MLFAIFLFLCVGIIGGFISGLLGLGGGVIIVPLLTIAFTWIGIDPNEIYRLAVGTSLASIAFTSFASARAHNKTLPLRWDLVKSLAPYLVVGILLGSTVATRINPTILKTIFTLFIYSLALRMLLDFRLKKRTKEVPISLNVVVGTIIGVACSLLGIGGGTLLVPYMTWVSGSMHCAVGVSAALGVFISIAGTTGYIINGLNEPGLPWGTLGYIHIPALTAIMITSIFFAPLGVRLAHKLSARKLKIVFGCAMFVIGSGMLWGLINAYNNAI